MAKSSKKDVNEDEKKIIKGLRRDSKESIDVMASRMGCSRQKIWRIIKKLEKKTIWGHTIVFSREILDMKRFVITIKFNAKPLDELHQLEKIQKAISEDLEKQIKNVLLDCFFFVHGPYDIFMMISAKDIKDALKVDNYIRQKMGENIKDTVVSEVLFNFIEGGIKNPQIDTFENFYKE